MLNLPTTSLEAQQHPLIEIAFQSRTGHAKPFTDVQLDVVFTSPSQKSITVPAFWAGSNQWRVRFASAEPGVHTFETRCSDAGNQGLHAQTGQICVEPYQGDNPLYRHGGVRVADDRRHFCHADGTPFFWLGDTWWMGLCGRLAWPQDFQALAQNRKALGFNVIQLVAGLYPDMPLFDERGRSPGGFCWDTDLGQINPAFFDEADQRIFHLVGLGLTPCILGAWGYYLPMIGLENMKRHWRYVMARWGALPVVWAAAGEQTLPWYLESPQEKAASEIRQKAEWSEVIAHMRTLNGFGRPITTHPFASARESVTDAALLDFEMQQTGHGLPTLHHARRAWEGWQTPPVMPVVSGESRYEGLEVNPTITARDAREAFWAHALGSGLAGHTYGANGVWQVNTATQPFGVSPSGFCWGNLPWDKAMELPGARHLGAARTFLAGLAWNAFVPQPVRTGRLERLLRQRHRLNRLLLRLGWRPATPTPVAAGVARDGSFAIAYTITNRDFTMDLRPMRAPVTASWVDPTSFERLPADVRLKGSRMRVTPRGLNAAGDSDWILLVQPQA
jgi:Protein of unknown function (DUF4038)/Domain of unknown function (DUF5060)